MRKTNALTRIIVNEETLAVWTKLQSVGYRVSWPSMMFLGASLLGRLPDNGGVSWSEVVGVLGRYTYALMAFFFAYCQSPGNIATYTHQFMASPCSLECGLLSYLALPSVHPIVGFILVLMSAGSFLQLLWDSVLMASFSFIQKAVGLLKPFTGHEGRADFAGVRFSPLSVNTAIVTLIVGVLLMRGNSGEIVNAVASMASGLLLVGILFILGILGGITRADICTGGGGG